MITATKLTDIYKWTRGKSVGRLVGQIAWSRLLRERERETVTSVDCWLTKYNQSSGGGGER